MAKEEALVFQDIFLNSTAMEFDSNEDCILPDDLSDINSKFF